ncbi:hypothetical protein KKA17_09635 [bacterium]|nr:hypothetical protein [bacterium]MBU1884565.1 hypothetical protein [bacterium]
MKPLLFSLIFILNLQAAKLDYNITEKAYSDIENKTIYYIFNLCSSDMNGIIKHGDYEKHLNFDKNIAYVQKRIETAQIDSKDKQKLQNNINKYKTICQSSVSSMKKNAPRLNTHYAIVTNSLVDFEKRICSTGFSPLIKKWHKLNHIKNEYLKEPSQELEQEFKRELDLVMQSVSELYLEEEQENAIFSYLKNYQSYFYDLSRSFKYAQYENIKEIKPLSYKIKSQIQFFVPYNL